MTLKENAAESLALMKRGFYDAPSGRQVALGEAIARATEGTVLYSPAQLDRLLEALPSTTGPSPILEITAETTGAAGRRLVQQEKQERVVALNFASAKNPGGGFINGAKAQEEDLSRCSALYPCLLRQPDFYRINRQASMLYTDHIIYSPDVPFFRDEALQLLDEPFPLSIITAPAPNAGEFLRRDPDLSKISAALHLRVGKVLAVAADKGHKVLVLGAWGCGVFRNLPHEVAGCFQDWLGRPAFRGAFQRVVFAVYDTGRPPSTRLAFEQTFGSGA